MNNIKIFSNFLFILFITISCVEKPSYSGKILDNSIDFNTLTSKNELLEKLGQPSFIDPVENKYFYYSEKNITKNFYNKKTSYMNIIVFSFDQNDKVLNQWASNEAKNYLNGSSSVLRHELISEQSLLKESNPSAFLDKQGRVISGTKDLSKSSRFLTGFATDVTAIKFRSLS